MMSDKLEIPRLRVKKDWYVGLYPDHADRSHPDVNDEQLVQDALVDSLHRMLFIYCLMACYILYLFESTLELQLDHFN